MSDLHLFHFLRPYWLLALLPLGYVIYCFMRQQWQTGYWEKVCDPDLLPHLLITQVQGKQRWPFMLAVLASLLVVVALAGPTWSYESQPVYSMQAARVIAMDLSPSMLATDIAPSRLTRTQYKVLDILNRSQEGQTGMVAFTSEAYTVSPLTNDARTIAAMITQLNPSIMPVAGQNLSAALQQSARLLQQGGAKNGSIILLTDAVPTDKDIALATQLRQQDITTSIIGVGTPNGAPIPTSNGYLQDSNGNVELTKLDIPALQQLAAAGGGKYVTMTNTDSDLDVLLKKTATAKNTKKTQEKADIWLDEGRWLLFLLLPLILIAWRKGWLEEIVG